MKELLLLRLGRPGALGAGPGALRAGLEDALGRGGARTWPGVAPDNPYGCCS